MTNELVEEAVAVLDRVLDVLAQVAKGVGRPGADLRRAIGDLRERGEADIRAAALGSSLAACFELARLAGASALTMRRVRAAIAVEHPQGLPAVAVVQASLRFSLVQDSRIVSATEFRSREDVDSVLAQLHAAFEPASDYAADEKDSLSYRALIDLHAAVTRHLVERERPLPRIVSYSFQSGMPALTLANRIYSDASRSDELIAENKVPHPLFMRPAGRALSA